MRVTEGIGERDNGVKGGLHGFGDPFGFADVCRRLVLAILDGHHALYKVGSRLEERGMLPLLQSGLEHTALHDYRLGQILDALFAANLNRVFGAVALRALEVYAIPTPWLHQDTTTITLYGAYKEATRPDGHVAPVSAGPGPPRPAYGHSKDDPTRPQMKVMMGALDPLGMP
jgi:transposase